MPDMKLMRKGSAGIAFYVLSGHENGFADRVKCGADIVRVDAGDWNRDMSPWYAPKCFRDGEDFGGGAGEYLAKLTQAIPDFEKNNGISPAHRALCGYSLVGLCALYGLYISDMFDGAVSASGSMWFDGWTEFMEANRPLNSHVRAYLSVGDRESRTRNQRLARVEECTREACEILNAGGHEAMFELNSGNHFNDPDGRLARGMDALFEMYMKN